VADIAHLDRGIFNKCSLQDEIHYQVTFPQMAIPYEGELFDDEGLTGEGRSILEMGLHTVIPYSTQAGEPKYITPSSEPSQDLGASIAQMTHLAFSLALLDGEVATEGTRTSASGVSKAYTFEKLNKRLASIADTQEAGWAKVFLLVCKWQGEDPEQLPPIPWDFPEQFEVRSLAQEIEDLAAILAGNPPSGILKAELWKRIAKKALPKLDAALMGQIEEEIEVLSTTSLQGEGNRLLNPPVPEAIATDALSH
jgi:hypothetical protein